MATGNPPVSPFEMSFLKETLCAQQQLLQKLYSELDAEREASATAASEALNVILRLQGEKAAVKMEAEQYKRLAEEKMCHAEESFAIVEDIIYQKELELAALDYQVQSYRYKLISLGCPDPASSPVDLKFPENLLQRSDSLSGKKNCPSLGRRNSAPILPKLKKPASPEPDIPAVTSYGEEIRMLDIRVREITGPNYQGPSPKSEMPRKQEAGSYPSSPNVHDVFEVPQVEKPYEVSSVKVTGKNEPDWLKKLFLQSSGDEKGLCKPSHIAAIDRAIVGPVASTSESRSGLSMVREVERAEGPDSREEELKLLKEIKEEINLLRDEIRSLKEKNVSDESSSYNLPEAMLHFWL
ncbi:Protein of unknown function- DUF593 [Striga hermonthica]|uniref:GTD-binding domain-containing protein n=1 Tax=Striga hermonthica TaxID=68872 RepID=A0A9N7MWN4_STRHE|nr:Protein of unknown function- DUF593 [Striga hermonthica]